MFERREWLWCLVGLCALSALFLGPALEGSVFLSMEVVHCCTPPWSGEWADDLDPHNPYLADHATIYYPWLFHSRAELLAGNVPLWTGESYGGAPYFGNFSVGLLSPFTWLFVVLPFLPAFAIVAGIKWLVAGVGTMLWARLLGVRGGGLVFAAIAFAFCGFQVVWINSALTHVSCLAPWCFWAVHRVTERPSFRRGAVLAAMLFVQWMGGHPETTFYVTLGALLYGVLVSASLKARGRVWGMLLLAHVLALALSAVQIWPFLEYALASEGLRLRGTDLFQPLIPPLSAVGIGLLAILVALGIWLRGVRKFWLMAVFLIVAGHGLRVLGLRPTLLLGVLPDLYGNPLDGGQYLGPYTYTDVAGGFCGGVLALLAVVACVKRRSGIAPVMGLLVLVLSARFYRIPLLAQLLEALPVFRETGATRALAVVALLLAVLGGMGLNQWLREPTRVWPILIASLCFAVGVACPTGWLHDFVAEESFGIEGFPATFRPHQDGGQLAERIVIAGRAPPQIAAVNITVHEAGIGTVPRPKNAAAPWPFAVEWIGVPRLEEGRYAVTATGIGEDGTATVLGRSHLDVVRPYRRSPRLVVLPLALGLLAVLGGCASRRLREIGACAIVAGELIVFGVRYNDFTEPENMPDVRQPIRFLQEQQARAGPFRVLGARTALQPNLHYLFGLHALRGYDALEPRNYNAVLRYLFPGLQETIWFEQDFSTMELESPLADVLNLRYVMSQESPDPGWHEVWQGGEISLYENQNVRARAFPVQQIYSLAEHGGEPPPPQLLDRAAVFEDGEDEILAGEAVIENLEYTNGDIRLEVRSTDGTVVIVSENLAPGWSAELGGEPIPLKRTHGTLMAVEVPPGSHTVELRYRPLSFRGGAAISMLAAVGILVGVMLRPRRAA